MPPSVGYILLHLLVLQRIVLLHPRVFHRTFKVEHIVRVVVEQIKVLVYGVPYIMLDGGLYVPVPLSVQMGVSHHVGFHLLAAAVLSRHSAERHAGGKSHQ